MLALAATVVALSLLTQVSAETQ